MHTCTHARILILSICENIHKDGHTYLVYTTHKHTHTHTHTHAQRYRETLRWSSEASRTHTRTHTHTHTHTHIQRSRETLRRSSEASRATHAHIYACLNESLCGFQDAVAFASESSYGVARVCVDAVGQGQDPVTRGSQQSPHGQSTTQLCGAARYEEGDAPSAPDGGMRPTPRGDDNAERACVQGTCIVAGNHALRPSCLGAPAVAELRQLQQEECVAASEKKQQGGTESEPELRPCVHELEERLAPTYRERGAENREQHPESESKTNASVDVLQQQVRSLQQQLACAHREKEACVESESRYKQRVCELEGALKVFVMQAKDAATECGGHAPMLSHATRAGSREEETGPSEGMSFAGLEPLRDCCEGHEAAAAHTGGVESCELEAGSVHVHQEQTIK